MLRRLLLLTLLGCSSGTGTNPDLSMQPGRDLAAAKDLSQSASSCSKPADCRLYSNNCDGCACQALRTDEIDPVCSGTPVSCFVDPCMGKTADCQAAHCVVK